MSTLYPTCPFSGEYCEKTCGLAVSVQERRADDREVVCSFALIAERLNKITFCINDMARLNDRGLFVDVHASEEQGWSELCGL